ncbi:MAG: ATP phosphoribosyltransferase regulatory subunit [Acidobacteria bacterium]|nr:ATP phosphoribosyltransferase regulatory subunit [Acidobacteriota bacterium]
MLQRRDVERGTEATPALPFPAGVRVLLPDEAARRRAVEGRIVTLLESFGYREVILPILDFAGCYDDRGSSVPNRSSYRLVDRDGELLTLRSDFTPMVARALAPALATAARTRVLYRGDVVRCESARLGGSREYFQIGAELIGDASFDADLEIARLAIAAAGGDVTFSCGDAALPPLLESEAARDRNASGLLAKLRRGTLEVSDLETCSVTAPVASRFTSLAAEVAATGSRLVVVFDPDDAGGYYSGIRFRIYPRGSNIPVARGGRYDALYPKYGADLPAVGFTLSVDGLEVAK